MRTIIAFFAALWRGLVRLFPVLAVIWRVGGFFLRVAIFLAIAYPLMIVCLALLGLPWLTAVAALLSVVAAVSLLIALVNPMFIAALRTINLGRHLLAFFSSVIGLELLFSVYFVVVPVTSFYSLVPVFLLVVLTLLFLPSFNPNGLRNFVIGARSVLIFLAVCITIIFFLWQIFPQSAGKIDGLRAKIDRGVAALLDTTTSVPKALVTETPVSAPIAVVTPTLPEKRDLISIPVHLKKGEVKRFDLNALNPFRNHFSICRLDGRCRVTDGRTSFVIEQGTGDRDIGNLSAAFKIVALSDKADLTVSAWRQ